MRRKTLNSNRAFIQQSNFQIQVSPTACQPVRGYLMSTDEIIAFVVRSYVYFSVGVFKSFFFLHERR